MEKKTNTIDKREEERGVETLVDTIIEAVTAYRSDPEMLVRAENMVSKCLLAFTYGGHTRIECLKFTEHLFKTHCETKKLRKEIKKFLLLE